MTSLEPLPIEDALPAIARALEQVGAAVVVAPPGTGKTTRLPPALLEAEFLRGAACWVQEPRRIAARAAARRVAQERGWKLGGEVGFEMRFDRQVSAATRLVYMTEGILGARIQADPFLEGVRAVVLDEFHERSVEADLTLALLREIRATVRPDLRVVVLSATLAPGPVASFLGAEAIHVAGRLFPVEIRYLERPDPSPLPRRVAAGVRRLWDQRPGERGSLLAFLPGASDIRRTADELAPWARERDVALLTLHGDLPPQAQDEVLRAPSGGTPRVILATNVAETSVTVEGLSAVVDSGLAKVLRHDPQTGLDRLEVLPISRSSADQRAGRAGRQGPGTALRLWTQHDDLSRPAETLPEILRADLCGPLLEILAWGSTPEAFGWFEPPGLDHVAAARETLTQLGAVTEAGVLTPLGQALRRFPLHPRLAGMVLWGSRHGVARQAAAFAALLSERDICLSGRAFAAGTKHETSCPSDLVLRLDLLADAEAAGFDPARLRELGLDPGACRAVARARDQIVRVPAAKQQEGRGRGFRSEEEALLRTVLAGYPDRVGKRREAGGDRFVLVGGAGARLAPSSSVRRAEFVVAARLDAGRKGERAEGIIHWASAVEPEWLAEGSPLETRTEIWFDADGQRVAAAERQFYRGLAVRTRKVAPAADLASERLAEEAARSPALALQPGREAESLISRCRFLAREMPQLEIPAWSESDWREILSSMAAGKTSFEELRRADLLQALRSHLGHGRLQHLDRHAPAWVEVPSGSRISLQYPESGPPILAVKIQETFGWRRGPFVAGGQVPVVLHLLSPSSRPLQVTADLESFWERTYPDVRKEMRGRYPKHRWPEDPWSAPPSRKTTLRAAR